jgi:methionyl-tRNA synthetase
VFGNFVNRITRFCASKFESKVPGAGTAGDLEKKLLADVLAKIALITQYHDEMEFRKAAAETRALWVIGNEYLQVAAPWTAFKTDVDVAALGVRTGLNLVTLFAILAQPFIPDAAGAVLDAMNVPIQNRKWPRADDAQLLDALPHGLAFTPPDVLFKKIEDAEIEAWKERFGGG